jgi:hypothetical protein
LANADSRVPCQTHRACRELGSLGCLMIVGMVRLQK